jgi:hypothetical protein
MTNYADYIIELPVDKNKKQDEVEMEILRTLFKLKQNEPFLTLLWKEFYESFLVAILFLCLNLPYIDNVIKSIFPISANLDIVFFGIKFILVMITYWLIKQSLF